MKIHVDLERCTGHGFCEGIAEDIFEVKPEGWVELIEPSPSEDRRDDVEEAVSVCPTRALSISD
jgi:ferredoxin